MGLAAGFFEEADGCNLHGGVDGFEHVDDGEDGDGGVGFHFDAGLGGDGGGGGDAPTRRGRCLFLGVLPFPEELFHGDRLVGREWASFSSAKEWSALHQPIAPLTVRGIKGI